MTEHTQQPGFGTTRWSLVLHAAENPAALSQLLTLYWGPMYAYCRRAGLSREEAADLVQDFLTHRVVDGSFLQQADPARGRFRTFVKASLKNFVIDQQRRENAHRRSPSQARLLHPESLEGIEPRQGDPPGVAFDRQWAATLLSNVMTAVEQDCLRDGRRVHWTAFERTVVRPMLGKSAPPSLAQLAAELGVESADKLSGMIQTVRRRFRRALHAAVADTLQDSSEVPQELEVLREFLGQ